MFLDGIETFKRVRLEVFDKNNFWDTLVFIILDICHMLKLMRNTLGDGGILVDADGQKIRWQYLVELNKLQQEEGLHLANKLSTCWMASTKNESKYCCANIKLQCCHRN